ncbi:MAG: ankyrin repeat domain-containing protein [Armatimonadetes bacterium]|nr:ankyrin repeat domain-containing protein [Armatimonadota bacterium]
MTNQADPHPYLVQLRKQAKELKSSRGLAKLTDAQFELAKSLGHPSWPKLVRSIQQRDLQASIRDGDQARFERILDATPRLATTPFDDGGTPLIMAIEFDDPTMISIIKSKGASMKDHYEGSAHSPLSWALTYGSMHAAVRLVELGEIPDLFCAGGLGSVDLLSRFWPNGELVPNASRTGSSRYDAEGKRLPCPPPDPKDQVSDALYLACRCGRLEAARWLLDHGADPNWPAFAGGTPLHWAEFSNAPGLPDLLVSKGGDESRIDPTFLATPHVFGIFVLIGWGFPAWRIKVRLDKEPALANARGGHGTALHVAIFNDRKDVVELLLAAGADKEALNAEGSTPLEQAKALGRSQIIEVLSS